MRLIDADSIEVKDVIGEDSEFANDVRKAMQILIDSQPTAYDVDKVIKQIESRSLSLLPESTKFVVLKDVKEIVKKGAI